MRELLVLCLCAPAVAQDLQDVLSSLDAQMVLVEGGSFIMGCTPEQHTCGADE